MNSSDIESPHLPRLVKLSFKICDVFQDGIRASLNHFNIEFIIFYKLKVKLSKFNVLHPILKPDKSVTCDLAVIKRS